MTICVKKLVFQGVQHAVMLTNLIHLLHWFDGIGCVGSCWKMDHHERPHEGWNREQRNALDTVLFEQSFVSLQIAHPAAFEAQVCLVLECCAQDW